jgi:hypothetical protein
VRNAQALESELGVGFHLLEDLVAMTTRGCHSASLRLRVFICSSEIMLYYLAPGLPREEEDPKAQVSLPTVGTQQEIIINSCGHPSERL